MNPCFKEGPGSQGLAAMVRSLAHTPTGQYNKIAHTGMTGPTQNYTRQKREV